MFARFYVSVAIMLFATACTTTSTGSEMPGAMVSAQDWGQPREVQSDSDKGKIIYMNKCSMCHGRDGRAVLPAASSFAGADRVVLTEKQMIIVIQQGKGIMPSFKYQLTNEELLNVIAFIRRL